MVGGDGGVVVNALPNNYEGVALYPVPASVSYTMTKKGPDAMNDHKIVM